MNDKLLPIGSVVLLKNATHRLMIIGYGAIKFAKPNILFDYWGCMYPEGQFESERHIIFNHQDILKVYGEGYSDDEEKQFRTRVEKAIKKCKGKNGVLTATPEQMAEIFAGKEN